MDQIISFFVAGTTLLLAFLIFANINQVDKKVNKWFGAFILCVFIIQFNDLLEKTDFMKTRTFTNDFLGITDFIVAPIFYLSVAYFVQPNRKWRFTDNLHFVPAFIMLFLLLLSLLIDAKEPTSTDKENAQIFITAFNFVFSFQVILYCLMAYKEINIYQKKLFTYSSNIESINLKWLSQVVICVLIITALWLLDNIFKFAKNNIYFDNFASLVYLTGIFYIAYYALKQKEFVPINNQEKTAIETIIESSGFGGNQKKLLSDDDLQKMKSNLLQLMKEKKPFLDPELSLFKLASQLDISSHLISYIINKGFSENFYQFINRYRIEEAKKMIQDPKMEHLSLMGIAFEVGFNSKTVFNTTFKKSTNQTPSEFKKALMASIQND
ncbi:helix-turn-helix transcriptional regulator [Flavobacterium psychroterrae]|uniref:Helix-turn-helix transcriptional regulator n=1 Tax=Flavobacterium psychroterrae TaxID=2133767 RepID=A0ABS5P6K5_9FLAO|nr:AraC family transcriptional regulator [Flavobacterium psychroterrae]MBS7229401.1 helix-turn-helix transcriptional regulator [Flavobacterium psychroterrae]